MLRTDPGEPIRWRCSACGDDGEISNWEDSPFDLRRRGLSVAGLADDSVIPNEVAAALRELALPDSGCRRLVFRMRAHHDQTVLACTPEQMAELVGFVAAEAKHEPDRRRRRRLHADSPGEDPQPA